MILARNSITLHHLRDITTVVWYYKLQASTASPPTKPTTETPSGWSTTEPSYTEGSTNSLYVVQKTSFSDGTFEYSDVSLSTSYEAAKAAYNKSVQAKDAADAAQEDIDNLEIGGRNLLLKTAVAKTATGEYVTNYSQSNYAKELLSGNTDDYFTASFDFVATGDFSTYTSKHYFYVQINGSATSPTNALYITEAQSGHYVSTFKLTAAQASSTSGTARIRLRYIPSGCGYTITNFKLEKGNRATDWTPAPEDVEADINEAKKTANNYIAADSSGLMVANMTDGNTYTPSNVPSGVKNTFIDEDSFQVRDGQEVLASFGEESRIGKEDKNHLDIDATGLSGVNADGLQVFMVDMDGGVEDIPVVPRTTFLAIMDDITSNTPKTRTVSLDKFDITQGKPVKLNIRVTLSPGNVRSQELKIFTYGTDSQFQVSQRGATCNVVYSASDNTLTFSGNIAESSSFTTVSFLILLFSYYTTTSLPAFQVGTRANDTIGGFSGTIGEALSASTRDQFACGRYNAEDPDYAFMVGNGSEEEGDSNAFAVTWDGNQLMALDETATSGTDADLYSAITALGWESEVLV